MRTEKKVEAHREIQSRTFDDQYNATAHIWYNNVAESAEETNKREKNNKRLEKNVFA